MKKQARFPNQVNTTAINRWLFNADTVDQALQAPNGTRPKSKGGDALGKTIVFARTHEHAEFIVSRFDLNYPHLKGQFAQVIDSHNSHAQCL